MIADLHSHYPMHLVPPREVDALKLICSPKARWRVMDRVRAVLIGLASRFVNYESFGSGPRVTVPLLRAGNVGVVLSVVYSPFDEFDLTRHYGSPPVGDYLDTALRHMTLVERDIADGFSGEAALVRNPEQLDAALAEDRIALVHCIEGGFHLGGTPEEVGIAVGELARRGVAYITLAHLVWRSVATNANAIPFLPAPLYRLLFPQPAVGLTELGRAAVTAMLDHGVLVDVSHMSRRALDDTLGLLDELDPGRGVPVIASHSACRLGRDRYNLSDETVERIAARDGVIGILLAEHQLTDGLRWRRTRTLRDSVEVLFEHLDRLREVTGSHRHAAIGSDLDGFIKPTLAGLENAERLSALERALTARYGRPDAELITSGNALRVLREHWGASRANRPAAPAG